MPASHRRATSSRTIRAARSAASRRPSRTWTLGTSATDEEPSPGPTVEREASDVAPGALPDAEVGRGHRRPEPGAPPSASGSGSSTRRLRTRASAGTCTPSSRRRPDAEPRMPSASKPGDRAIPGDPRSTRSRPTTGGSASPMRALTSARRRTGSHVVQVFSPVTSHPPAGSGSASVPGMAPRDGEPPLSSVAVALMSAPSSRTAGRAAVGPHRATRATWRAAPVTCTCIANPSAVEPSTPPIAARTSTASTIPAPIPPSAAGTTSRCSPASTIAWAARGSNSSPRSRRSSASSGRVERGLVSGVMPSPGSSASGAPARRPPSRR